MQFLDPMPVIFQPPSEMFELQSQAALSSTGGAHDEGAECSARARSTRDPKGTRPASKPVAPRRSPRLAAQQAFREQAGGASSGMQPSAPVPPVGPQGGSSSSQGRAKVSPPTQKQIDYIALVCARRGWDLDLCLAGLDKALASKWIDANK